MKKSKGFNGDLTPEHKRIANRTTIGPTTDIDTLQEPTEEDKSREWTKPADESAQPDQGLSSNVKSRFASPLLVDNTKETFSHKLPRKHST